MICWLDLVTKVESVLASALALRLLQAIALGSKQQHIFSYSSQDGKREESVLTLHPTSLWSWGVVSPLSLHACW